MAAPVGVRVDARQRREPHGFHQLERPLGVLVQLGGQTPLKLAADLEAHGVPILTTQPRVPLPELVDRENVLLVPPEDPQALADTIEQLAADHPDKFAVATSVADVRRQFAAGLVSLPMGMENGSPIDGNIDNVRHFYDRGIRYLSLSHGSNNAALLVRRGPFLCQQCHQNVGGGRWSHQPKAGIGRGRQCALFIWG